MKKKYTYSQLVEIAEKAGANNADYVIGNMMDDIQEETGQWPNWNDIAPEDIVKIMIRG